MKKKEALEAAEIVRSLGMLERELEFCKKDQAKGCLVQHPPDGLYLMLCISTESPTVSKQDYLNVIEYLIASSLGRLKELGVEVDDV